MQTTTQPDRRLTSGRSSVGGTDVVQVDYPAERAGCYMERRWTSLLPARLVPATGRSLVVNPTCCFSWHGLLPPEVANMQRFVHDLYRVDNVIWVLDPYRRTQFPYLAGKGYWDLVTQARRGNHLPAGCSSEDLRTLSLARILVDPKSEQRAEDEWRYESAAYADMFRSGYAIMSGLLPPLHLAEVRRYYKHQIESGTIKLGDRQCGRRYFAYNDPLGKFYHHQLIDVVSAVVGEPVKPSFVYFASYIGGAKLLQHTDRAQCVYTITLLIDYFPEPEFESPWPIHLLTRAGDMTIFQAIGDSLLYRGCSVPHYRTELPLGHSSTSLIFSYVPLDFTGRIF